MTYEARKAEDSENYEVVNVETEEVVAVHEPPDAKEHAEDQVELLHEIEKELDAEESGHGNAG